MQSTPTCKTIAAIVSTIKDPRHWLMEMAAKMSGSTDACEAAIAEALVPALEHQCGWTNSGHLGDWPLTALARLMHYHPTSKHFGYWYLVFCAVELYTSQCRRLHRVVELQRRIIDQENISISVLN